MVAGVVFSFLTAIGMNIGNLMEKRAVDRMALLSARRTGSMFRSLLSSRLWMGGFLLCLLALALQVMAFALAPLVVVQSIYGAGLLLLVLVSRMYLREPLGKRELVGLAFVVAALALVSVSIGGSTAVGHHDPEVEVTLIAVLSVVVAESFAAFAARRYDASWLYGLVSGILYGAAALGTKGASTMVERYGVAPSLLHIALSPYPYLFCGASALGLLTFQTGIQRCRISVVAPLSSVLSSTYVVLVGMALFDEPLPTRTLPLVLRMAGFAGVLVGTMFLVAPEGQRALELKEVSAS